VDPETENREGEGQKMQKCHEFSSIKTWEGADKEGRRERGSVRGGYSKSATATMLQKAFAFRSGIVIEKRNTRVYVLKLSAVY